MAGGFSGRFPLSLRLLLVVALAVAYCTVFCCFRLILSATVVITHFAYVPVVLAGLWWGRRAVYVAGFLGLFTVAGCLWHGTTDGVLQDAGRSLFLILVAYIVGAFSEKAAANHRELEASRERYGLLVEKSLAGVVLFTDGIVTFANSRVKEILGWAPHQMVGRSFASLVHQEDLSVVNRLDEQRRSAGQRDLHYEARLLTAQGETVWVEVASSVINQDETGSVLVTLYDITRRKEGEKKRRELTELAREQERQLTHAARLVELGEMAAAISHEVNQPLTGIRNFASNALYMLEEGDGDTAELRANLQHISEQVVRASKVISRMREVTRAGETAFGPVNLNRVVEDVIDFLAPQFERGRIETVIDLAEDLPMISGDAVRLEQVFLNLLNNARQALEDSPFKRIVVKTRVAFDGWVTADISDTGMGFSPETGARLFEPFFTTKRSGHGTGLGLSVSQGIARAHGGRIEATGAPKKGAQFVLRLPPVRPAEAEEAQDDR